MQLATHSLIHSFTPSLETATGRPRPPTLLDAVEDEREWRGGEGAAAEAAAGESAAEDGEVRRECEAEERQRGGGGCGCCSGGRLQGGDGRFTRGARTDGGSEWLSIHRSLPSFLPSFLRSQEGRD